MKKKSVWRKKKEMFRNMSHKNMINLKTKKKKYTENKYLHTLSS
jgi:hypothetical protein